MAQAATPWTIVAGERPIERGSPSRWSWPSRPSRPAPRASGPRGGRIGRRPAPRGWGRPRAPGRTRWARARARAGPSLENRTGGPRPTTEAGQQGAHSEAAPEGGRIGPPTRSSVAFVSPFGSLALANEDQGPPDGLTLDRAIERLVRQNLELRSKAFEIPQADADILTAGLRANPILYSDVQCYPYGSFSRARPGGQTQYDINVSYPLDVTHKRKARTLVACRAKKVLEAQFQDAIRVEIDNLYTRFVDVLAARETVRLARKSVAELEKEPEKPRGAARRCRAPTTSDWRSSARPPRSA